MDSSREGVVKKLNGHGNGLNGHGAGKADDGAQQPPLSGLVDELAQAMNMARDSLERPQPAPSLNPASPPLPAMAPPRSLFEDEDDDAAMPIPSTWRTPPEPPKSGTLRDQLRAAGFGFATGLAVIVPVVLVMTGRLGDISFDALFGGGEPAGSQISRAAAVPEKAPVQVQQRTVSTTIITPAKPSAPAQAPVTAPRSAEITPAAVAPAAAKAPANPAPAEPEVSWADAIKEGKSRIQSGDIRGGRETLLPAVAANEPEAIMALAETYDPNMLAAWGVRDVAADVEQARRLYRRALQGGVESARGRLQGLN